MLPARDPKLQIVQPMEAGGCIDVRTVLSPWSRARRRGIAIPNRVDSPGSSNAPNGNRWLTKSAAEPRLLRLRNRANLADSRLRDTEVCGNSYDSFTCTTHWEGFQF